MAHTHKDQEMRVRVKKPFFSPLKAGLRGMAEVGEEMNVPVKGFWLRRLKDGDCEVVKKKSKAPAAKAKGSK